MDDARRVVREGYDRIAHRYEAWGDHGGVRRRYVGLLRDAVPTGARVVDLGCGTGKHGTTLLTDRYRVVLAGHADARLLRRLPELTVVDVDGSTALVEIDGAPEKVLEVIQRSAPVAEFARVVRPLAQIYREVVR